MHMLTCTLTHMCLSVHVSVPRQAPLQWPLNKHTELGWVWHVDAKL